MEHIDAYPPTRPYAPRGTGEQLRPCAGCGRASRLRTCSRCAVRKSRGALAAGPCAACGLVDPRVLRIATLASGPAVLCACCSAVLGRRALALDELRREVEGAAWSCAGEEAAPRLVERVARAR